MKSAYANNKKRKQPINLVTVANAEPLAPDEFVTPGVGLDLWQTQEKRIQKGLATTPITVEHPKKTYNLSKGVHYFEVENAARKSIVCTSCPVRHGGILEAHLLTRYKLEDGILYLDGQAINQTKESLDNVGSESLQ